MSCIQLGKAALGAKIATSLPIYFACLDTNITEKQHSLKEDDAKTAKKASYVERMQTSQREGPSSNTNDTFDIRIHKINGHVKSIKKHLLYQPQCFEVPKAPAGSSIQKHLIQQERPFATSSCPAGWSCSRSF